MAVQKPTIPKGTRDFGPAEVQKRKYILNTIETVFKKYGFMPIETPTMENLSTLTGKYGDDGDKLLFNVLESGDFWSETGLYLSKYQYYIIRSLEAVTKRVFLRKEISENDAKDYSKLLSYLEENFGKICRQDLPENLLFGIGGYEKVINELEEMLVVITVYLNHFYSRAGFHDSITEIEVGQKFNQFVTTNFSQLAVIFNNITDYNYIKTEVAKKGLRYDLTVPFARYVVMNRNEITFPFKRYQMQPVWRADRPQKGRYREFWQCDADVVGSDSLLNEVDLIQIYIEAFELLKIPVKVRYNNRKLLDGLSHILGLSDKLVEMTIILDKEDKIGRDAVVNELKDLGANPNELDCFLDALSLPFDAVKVNRFFDKNEISRRGMDELKVVSNGLNISFQGQDGFESKVIHDLALARGLSYYTGAIFEVVSTEGSLKSSIGGGGRYDNLTGIFGLPNVSGVGISFGLDRIYDVIEELNLFPEGLNVTSTQVLICAFEETTQTNALSILKKLRDTQIASELYPELPQSKKEKENPLQKPMNYADALKIPFRLIIKEESMMLKDINGTVIPVTTIEEIIEKLKN